MVVAEIPLWVTHNMDSPETGTHPSHYKSGNTAAAAANGGTSTAAAAGSTSKTAAAAFSSLALLQEEKKKCAIYAVDVHPSGTKFATAGGDGTVRLWSTATLFSSKHKGGRFQYHTNKSASNKKPAPPTTTTTEAAAAASADTTAMPPPPNAAAAAAGPIGGYVSTTASSGSSSSSSSNSNCRDGSSSNNSSSSSDDDASSHGNKKEQPNGNRSSASSSSSSSSSSSVDNATTGSATEASSVINGTSSMAQVDLEEIHDLNNVVRRKKDGETSASSPLRKAMNNDKQAPTPSPWKGLNQEQQQQQQPQPANDNTKKQQQHHQHHRLLCTLSAHTGSSVLAIRFSNTGNFLASAGDDGCVCLYAPSSPSSSSALVLQGNLVDGGAVAVEHWTRIALCRGHNLDVVGLAWAPDDSHLVSCSLDRETPIIVWKLTDLTQPQQDHDSHHHHSMIRNPYKILGRNVHTSTVKGVTFDPAGSYLASSGDDPAVCIWRAHDDWGLEKRIDAKSGIFRQWKNQNKQQQQPEMDFPDLDDTQALSSQSLFRRISWSTDGAFICSTNSVVKNKHVASTISRQGWSVAAAGGAGASSAAAASAAGAANLVGHRQPVVVSRHAAQLLAAAPKKKKKKKQDNSDDDEDDSQDQPSEEDDADADPEYATLLALGDKRGFVTVWSTRKSRPIFKLQCSETRCTVTDLAWGRLRRGDGSSSPCGDNLILLVSLLDGQVVALKFDVPKEIGPILSAKDQARVFALRYGIDVDDAGTFGQRRLLVGGDSGRSQFLENALQINLENSNNATVSPPVPTNDNDAMDVDNAPHNNKNATNELSTLSQQTESRSKGGKKRVQPVLVNRSGNNGDKKRARPSSSPNKTSKATTEKQATAAAKDPLERAMNAAERASAITETAPMSPSGKQQTGPTGPAPAMAPRQAQFGRHGAPSLASFSLIPHSTERIHSVDLPVATVDMLMAGQDATGAANEAARMTAECTNSSKIPYGSKGASLPCTDVTISRSGRAMWRDQITGTSCSAMAASPSLLVVGTADGTIQLFATSPSLGWNCGNAFRSHPPLVVGQPVVALQVKEMSINDNGDGRSNDTGAETRTLLLALTADGSFGVYSLVPDARVLYKGSIMPAMTHISLGLSFLEQQHQQQRIAKLSRIQITESGRLLLLLSLQQQAPLHASTNGTNNGTSTLGGGRGGAFERGGRSASSASASMGPSDGGTGGSLQAFVYNQSMELWMRLADSKSVLSDFYSSLPSLSSQRGQSSAMAEASVSGPLSRLDDAVRMGALDSALKPSLRGRSSSSVEKQHQAASIYSQSEQDLGTFIPTRSHCEDRMACALALGSAAEFRHWLSLYARVLAVGGHESLLRMLVDMLMGTEKSSVAKDSFSQVGGGGSAQGSACWWLSSAPQVLGLDRKDLVRSIIVREMSKNRALQRTTNEIALELDS